MPCPPPPDLISTNIHCSNLRAEFIYAPTSRDLFEKNVKKRRKRKRWREEKLFGRSERTSEREREEAYATSVFARKKQRLAREGI